ncbi:MAG: 6-pyruvoyl trahydropterin synthase family protein [Spirochaetia bacterium]
MFRTGIQQNAEIQHALRGDFGEESIPHSHPYVIEWIISTNELDDNGFAADISVMEEVLDKTLGDLSGKLLNDLPFFSLRQPSLENLAVYLHTTLKEKMSEQNAWQPAMRCAVKIWENDSAWASFSTAP